MYIFYADESGDTGLTATPTRYFVLSSFVVHELRWHAVLDQIVAFRRVMRARYGLKLREEIHAGHYIHRPGAAARIPKSLRLRLLGDVLTFQAALPDVSVVNVVVDKHGKPADYDVFENAWRALVQRLHNTMSHRNFPGPQNASDLGVLVVDRTDEVKLRSLVRKMRVYNLIPSRFGSAPLHIPLTTLIEDAVHRDSTSSYFLQLSDVNAFFLHQKMAPCGYVRRKGARQYFNRLNPILCTVASATDPQGIVRL